MLHDKDYRMMRFDPDEKPKDPFLTPEGYFDQFEDRMMARLENLPELRKEPKVIRMRPLVWWAGAAAVITLAAGTFFWQRSQTEISDSEALEHYITYNTSINQLDLINMMDEADIRELAQDIPVSDQSIEAALRENPDFELMMTE